jgi:hypothetical protein
MDKILNESFDLYAISRKDLLKKSKCMHAEFFSCCSIRKTHKLLADNISNFKTFDTMDKL